MSYNTLLAGSNTAAIEDIFVHMEDTFFCVTTSLRYADIIRHIRIFKPEVFILCLRTETREVVSRMLSVKAECEKYEIPFVIIGEADDCSYFKRIAINAADLTLVKPLSNRSIEEQLATFMRGWKRTNHSDSEKSIADVAGEKAAGGETDSSVSTNFSDEAMDIVDDILDESRYAERKHILVVDDDPKMLKLIKRQLSDNYDVATAVNGKVAMRFLENKRTDLILLDYEMPGKSGAEVLAEIRAVEKNKSLPVIFLTGVSERDKIAEVMAYNPQGYLLKPIDRTKLINKIKDQIG